jgi:sec-independent protein translocase protein TatC
MTDGSDGNDERPSDADAAPESSDDAVTSGDDDAAPDEDDASESPATDDGADSSDSTPDDEGSTEIDDGTDGGDEAEGDNADNAADADDDSAEPSNPQPEAALDPSATPPAAGNGTAGTTTRETADGADADTEADTADDESGDGNDDGGGGLGYVPDDEWEGNASGVTENYADANGGRVADDADADADADADGDQPVPGDGDQPVPSEPERDVAGVADDRMVDTTAAEAAEEDDAPIAGEALTDNPETPPEQRAEGEAPLAEDVVGQDVGGPGVEDDSEGLFGDGPETDEEMPLTVHIEEMMYRLGAVFAVAGIVVFSVLLVGNSTAGIPSTEEIIIFLWDSHVDFQNYKPYVYGPLEFLLTKLKVASLAGLIVALPVFVYQTYGFMRPGLYPHERRYYLAAIPTSLVLALVGVAFAHFLVLPAIFQYFISYTEVSAELAFGLRETFNLILLLMGYMAIVFQIPLFIQLATMMGVVTREWLEGRRLIFWGSFLGISFVVSPDPTGMSPIIVAATMVVLFEGTLALLRWTGN